MYPFERYSDRSEYPFERKQYFQFYSLSTIIIILLKVIGDPSSQKGEKRVDFKDGHTNTRTLCCTSSRWLNLQIGTLTQLIPVKHIRNNSTCILDCTEIINVQIDSCHIYSPAFFPSHLPSVAVRSSRRKTAKRNSTILKGK